MRIDIRDTLENGEWEPWSTGWSAEDSIADILGWLGVEKITLHWPEGDKSQYRQSK